MATVAFLLAQEAHTLRQDSAAVTESDTEGFPPSRGNEGRSTFLQTETGYAEVQRSLKSSGHDCTE